MSLSSLLKKLLNIALVVVESARIDADGSLVIAVRPRKSQLCRCFKCGQRRPVYDMPPTGPRRWRSLDFGTTKVFLEYALPRVSCPEHGVHPAGVPWAHHASRFTRDFEEQVAWLCVHANRSVVAAIMRIDWKSVGGICKRVYDRLDAQAGDRFAGLVRIGVDETSYKKGHKYMTVVLDHDTGRVVWCGKEHGKKALRSFFDLLTEEQRASVEVVTADGAKWIAEMVEEACPNAERVMDPFHVVQWMTDLLDDLRKEAWREAAKVEREAKKGQPKRGRGRPGKGEEPAPSQASAIKGSRYALLKNPESLTGGQQASLDKIAREYKPLYRAYLLKEDLRDVFRSPDGAAAAERLDKWLARACRSRNGKVKELSKKVRRHKEAIVRSVELGISNARVEAVNNKIKLTVRMGYGFRNFDNLVALVMLRCSNLPIKLPGRAQAA